MKIQKNFLFPFILILYSIFYILYSPSAHADGISLSVSPSLIHIQAIPPTDARTPITLENQGSKSLNIQILLKPFRASNKEDGEIEYLTEIPDNYKKILSKIQVTDDGVATTRFELSPQQKKNLEINITIPKDEPVSDYYFSIIFLASKSADEDGVGSITPQLNNPTTESPAGPQSFSAINAGIGINILLSIITQDNPRGIIEEFSSPSLLKSGPVDFTVKIKNTGSQVFAPKGIIFIKNMFGQVIGRIDLDSRNILAGSTRSLTDIPTASSSSNFSSPNSSSSLQKARWPERFLLGPYTATLNLALSDKGPIYNRSIIFFALPIQLIIGAILGIIIITIIFLRVRYRLKNDK